MHTPIWFSLSNCSHDRKAAPESERTSAITGGPVQKGCTDNDFARCSHQGEMQSSGSSAPDPPPPSSPPIQVDTSGVNLPSPGDTSDADPPNRDVTTTETTQTPYQRMQQLLAARADTAGRVLKGQINDSTDNARVTNRMRLLWISEHTYKSWTSVRLHFVDAGAPETLEDMLSVRLFYDKAYWPLSNYLYFPGLLRKL
ncbi:unnamed protein product [Phytophthora lilii]|uniref:Unnamed protein product n=1 Tax=Phytophthora lilii TaxID=2077276 RepID=A0A9W7CHW3_9STRA|nr:unnamed protein product [Phytophthora lilii]